MGPENSNVPVGGPVQSYGRQHIYPDQKDIFSVERHSPGGWVLHHRAAFLTRPIRELDLGIPVRLLCSSVMPKRVLGSANFQYADKC